MKRSFFALAMLLALGAQAESGSEIVYFPKSGESAVRFGYDMGLSASYKNTSGSEVTNTGSIMGFNYMFGVDDTMTVGASFTMGTEQQETKTGSTTSTTKGTGMSDLMIAMRMTSGMWFYGADLGLPFANKIVDGTNGNRFSGGIGVIPMGGLIMANGSMNWGAVAGYSYFMDRKVDSKSGTTTTTSTVSGGNALTLTPFAEWNYGTGFLNAQFSLHSIGDTTTKTGSTSTTAKTTNYNTLKLGGTYNFTPSITGLANYTMDMYQSNSDAGTPAYTASTLNLGARMVF